MIVILQVGFIPALRPLGVVPNLVMVAVVLLGLEGTASQAVVAALAGGLVLDLTSGADFGLRTGLFLLAALATGLVHRSGIYLLGPTAAIVVVAAVTLLQTLMILLPLLTFATSWPIGLVVGRFLLELMLNLTLTAMMRPAIGWLTASAPGAVVAR